LMLKASRMLPNTSASLDGVDAEVGFEIDV
jgi:hypothetical protein